MTIHRYPSTTIVKDWALGATVTREDCNQCGAIIWRRTVTRNDGADPEVTMWANPDHLTTECPADQDSRPA